jgi:peptidyl-prolyl cis-trans isomerase A (cyclophilin A)
MSPEDLKLLVTRHSPIHHVGAACGVLVALVLFSPFAQSAEPTALKDRVRVTLTTVLGAIEMEVFPERAPLSACDFLAYVDAGLYEGAAFYRVVRSDNDRGSPKIQVIQGGLQDDSKARPPIAHETTQQTGLKHVDGALSLARGAIGTGGAAAFFVVIGDQPALDFGGTRNADGQGFAVFGRVVRGMEVIHRIHRLQADATANDPYLEGQLLRDPVVIAKAYTTTGASHICKAASR